MQISICIYKVFAYGGVTRDMLKIARECMARGHRVRVYTLRWLIEPIPEMEVVIVPVKALANHTLYRKFSNWVEGHAEANPVDLVLGMNKMPNLDVYFAGDSCYEEKAQTQRNWLYRLTPRYRHFAKFEQEVFASDKKTLILAISDAERPRFQKHYQTPDERFVLLPPGIERNRSGIDISQQKVEALRAGFNLKTDDYLLLFIGSGFITKGLDRLLIALHHLEEPRCKLLVVGEDRTDAFERMAKRLGVMDRLQFLGGRDDIPLLLASAQGLVLPAYDENAGAVILEAMIAGVPVLTTSNCGYAHYVSDTNAGLVVPTPFSTQVFDEMFVDFLTSPDRNVWSENGKKLANDESIYSLAQRAADYLEGWAEKSVTTRK